MNTFENIGLRPEILKALQDLNFETPTPIQNKAIPYLLKSQKDLIALAQTGTGKTAAFSLPIIQQLNAESKQTQALILCPTRELCIQITKDLTNFTKYARNISIVSIYGGDSMERQIRNLHYGAQIVVGTPGRVLDLIKRRKLNIENIKWLVIDEADEILNMGFKEDLDEILAQTPTHKQTLLFSATMPRSIISIAQKYMKNAEEISIAKEVNAIEKIKHLYYTVHAKDRYAALKRILDISEDIYAIVFCRTKIETQEIASMLMQDHYSAEAIHGDLSQSQRNHVMTRFRKKQTKLLIATDVAARGIDVTDLTHVINYELPENFETYVHRSGRTGRAGKSGISLSIIHMRETYKIRLIEKRLNLNFTKEQVPQAKDIFKKQLLNFIHKVEKAEIKEEEIQKYLPDILKKLEKMDRETLIKQFISLELNQLFDAYKNAPDLNTTSHESHYSGHKNKKSFHRGSKNFHGRRRFNQRGR